MDLKVSLLEFCADAHIQTGIILSAVGSLKVAVLRSADGKTEHTLQGPFEVTSLSGTITNDKAHLHLSIFDDQFKAYGGHVKDGCIVHTTMEIAVLDLSEHYETERTFDPETGYDELRIFDRIG
jgi:predicted DNA-binding protein with PD1-like motif